MIQELCLTLLVFAAQHAGYPQPSTCPTVERAPLPALQAMLCPERKCPVSGLYVYGESRLLLAQKHNPKHLYPRSVIVHELVHYLQDLNGESRDKSCKANMLRERVAFFVQEKYMRSQGLRTSLRHNLKLYACDDNNNSKKIASDRRS